MTTEDILAKVKEEGRTYRHLGIGFEKMPPYKIDEWRAAWQEGWREEDALMSRPLPPPIPEPKPEINVSNIPPEGFMVSAHGDDIVILAFQRTITKKQAINLAAWLVALSGVSDEEFQEIVARVMNT